jgi:AraC-like DNA-binding protein
MPSPLSMTEAAAAVYAPIVQVDVVRRGPRPFLRPFLHGSLEGWSQVDGTAATLREVPFPGVPVIFGLDGPWEIDRSGSHECFVAGLHDVPTLVRGEREWSCIELRLTPLGARRLLGLPMHELRNRTVELDDVLHGAGELADRLRDMPSWTDRFDLLETYLAHRLAAAGPPSPEVEWSWQRLVRTRGLVRIRELERETGWSPRRLIARFKEEIGLAPKAAARVIRFDRAATVLRRGSATSLAALAYECGYADQPHLNREFRELAGTTPAAFGAAVTGSGGVAA